MREIRQSGSEGGEGDLPDPYNVRVPSNSGPPKFWLIGDLPGWRPDD